jgi:hypothetical protein
MKLISKALLFGCIAYVAVSAAAKEVVEDQGVGLSREELEYIVKLWSPDMQQAAANDAGDRIELLNMALANKKLAAMAPDAMPGEGDAEAYWRLQLNIRNMKSQYVVKQYLASLDIPDMNALAEERYETQKDKYALVPEKRLSSHILLLCAPGGCDRDARRVEAEKILAELEAGADFGELAARYSEDRANKDKGGRFDRWLGMGETQVAPHYLGAVFEIENVGDHSGIVDTRFGLHIIQLDGIEEAHYKPYAEVKDQIIATLRKEYIDLAAKQFDAGFRFTDETYIDSEAVEEILAPYKTAQ